MLDTFLPTLREKPTPGRLGQLARDTQNLGGVWPALDTGTEGDVWVENGRTFDRVFFIFILVIFWVAMYIYYLYDEYKRKHLLCQKHNML